MAFPISHFLLYFLSNQNRRLESVWLKEVFIFSFKLIIIPKNFRSMPVVSALNKYNISSFRPRKLHLIYVLPIVKFIIKVNVLPKGLLKAITPFAMLFFSTQQFDKQVFWYFCLNWLLLFTCFLSYIIIAETSSFFLWVKSEARFCFQE